MESNEVCLHRGNLIYFPITTPESRKCFPALSNLGVIIKVIIKFILFIFLPSGLQSYTVYCPVSKLSLSLFFFNAKRFSLVACAQLQLEAESSNSFFFFFNFSVVIFHLWSLDAYSFLWSFGLIYKSSFLFANFIDIATFLYLFFPFSYRSQHPTFF